MTEPVKTPHSGETRASRKKARTRRALLEAARRVCAEQGYQALTVAGIAEAADVGVGTFYYHFHSKEDVLEALLDAFMERIAARISENRAAISDPVQRLRGGYRIFFELGDAEQDLLRVYYSSAARREAFARHAYQFFLNDAIEIVRLGQHNGAFRGGNPEFLARWMFGAATETVQWWLEQGLPLDRSAADELTDLMLRGLAAG